MVFKRKGDLVAFLFVFFLHVLAEMLKENQNDVRIQKKHPSPKFPCRPSLLAGIHAMIPGALSLEPTWLRDCPACSETDGEPQRRKPINHEDENQSPDSPQRLEPRDRTPAHSDI